MTQFVNDWWFDFLSRAYATYKSLCRSVKDCTCQNWRHRNLPLLQTAETLPVIINYHQKSQGVVRLDLRSHMLCFFDSGIRFWGQKYQNRAGTTTARALNEHKFAPVKHFSLFRQGVWLFFFPEVFMIEYSSIPLSFRFSMLFKDIPV